MNSGVAYMSEVSLQRLNSEGVVLYEEKFSFLDSFGQYEKITKVGLSLLTTESAQERYSSFINWIQEKLLSGKSLDQGQYIDLTSESCPLPSSGWEIIPSLEVSSTLKVRDGVGFLETNFDKVGTLEDRDYFLEFFLVSESSDLKSIDFLKMKPGELVYKSETSRNELVFDINRQGELIVIGQDADHYFINEKGELCYKY